MFTKYQQMILARKYRDENTGDPENGGQGAAPTEAEQKAADNLAALQKQMADMKADNDRLTAKVEASNRHTKEAERKQREAEELKNKEAGNFEELYNSSQKALATEVELNKGLNSKLEKRDVDSVASKIAMAMKPLDGAGDDLRSKVAQRLKSTSEGVKVIDNSGELTISTFEQLQSELLGSADIAYMLQGNQSTGGGANGDNNNSGSATQNMTSTQKIAAGLSKL